LLLCAVASCYTTTFRAVAEHSRFEYTDLQVEVEGDISRAETGYNFGGVLVRANLTVPPAADHARALKLLHKAEGLCLVSRALSVEKRFEPRVEVSETRVEIAHSLSPSGKGDDHRPDTKAQ
jgi:organic hydroperoxide reductase OsmC/OhrA